MQNKCPSQITRDTCSNIESKLISTKLRSSSVGSAASPLAILTYLGVPVGTLGVVLASAGLESLPGIDVGVPGNVVLPGVVGTLRLPGLDVEPSVSPVELVLEPGTVELPGVVVAGIVSPAGAVAPGLVASGVVAGFFMLPGAVVFLPFFALVLSVLATAVATVETWEDE
jgi:hypothetical protein